MEVQTMNYDGSKIADKLVEINESLDDYGAYGYMLSAALNCFMKAIKRYNEEQNDAILTAAKIYYKAILPPRVTLKALKKFAENQK